MRAQSSQHRDELGPVLAFLRTLWSVNHAMEQTSIRMESMVGLTAQQRFVIRIVGKLPGITPSELAALLHIDRGSVTALLKRLESRNLLTRETNAGDRRRISLRLRPLGKKLDVPLPSSVEHAVAMTLAQSSASDIAAVKRTLKKLVNALDKINQAARTED